MLDDMAKGVINMIQAKIDAHRESTEGEAAAAAINNRYQKLQREYL